jgi:DNA repair protein RadD
VRTLKQFSLYTKFEDEIMRFDDLFARASVDDLQNLLGKPALRLINLLDHKTTSSTLRDVVIGLYGYEGLLLEPRSRNLLFDLMRLEEAQQLLVMLNERKFSDPIHHLKNLSFRKQEYARTLFSFFALALSEAEAEIIQDSQDSLSSGYGLFLHQRQAVQKIKNALYSAPYRVVLHMPTGAGKTRTAMNIIVEHLRSHEPTIVIWLAHSEELCVQADQEFQRAWKHLGNRDISIGRFWGKHQLNLESVVDGIVIAGLAKTYSAMQKSVKFISDLGKSATLIIMDEAHSAVAPTYADILNTLTVFRRNTSLLGLTATPGRTWADIDVDRALADFFHRRKVTLTVDGYLNPVDFLVSEQYLAKVDYRPIYHNKGIELSNRDLNLLKEALEIPDDILRRLAEDEIRNLLIVQTIEELVKRHRRILVFAATVEHSNLLAAVLSARGINASSVTGKTSTYERQLAISKFKDINDEPRVLCNYGVLTTGFDAPLTSAAVIARPTKSLVLYSQMIGRAIRGKRAGGNEVAEIVTVVDYNLPGFNSVADAFNNWEDIWE